MYLREIITRSFEKEIAIHCNTLAKANLLFEWFEKSNVKWYATGEVAKMNHNLWDVSEIDTCYVLTDGKISYTNTNYCIKCGYDIIDFNNIADFNIPKKPIKPDIKYKNMLIVCKDKKYVLLKYDGNEYKVQCHEQDTFDWRIGFGLALSKVFGKQPKWKEHREYYRNNKKRKLDYKKYALWCIIDFYHNDMFDIDNLGYRIKAINENGKVDL